MPLCDRYNSGFKVAGIATKPRRIFMVKNRRR